MRNITRRQLALNEKFEQIAACPSIPYVPDTWNVHQQDLHVAVTLEEAFHYASCLAGGWYRRPVTIDMKITEDNDERYMLRPSEVPVLAGWTPCYEVKAVRS